MSTTQRLLKQLLETMMFFELCTDDEVPRHIAIKQEENILATLQALPPDDIRAFLALADEERKKTADPAALAFLAVLPQHFDEELAAA